MADIVQFEMKGLDQLQEALEKKGKDGTLALRIALSAGGGVVRDAMRDGCPVEKDGENSGFLKGQLRVKTIVHKDVTGIAIVGASNAIYPGKEGKRGRVSFKTAGGKVVDFISKHAGQVTASRVARWLEFGTSHARKFPFMSQGWEKSKVAAFNKIVEKLKEKLEL